MKGPLGGGDLLAVLDSEPPEGSGIPSYHSKFIVVMFGFTYSLSGSNKAGTIGSVELEVPALFKTPSALNGPASWISATLCAGKGKSATTFSLGYAHGKAGWDTVYGYDIGFDMMYGISMCYSGCN